MKRMLIAVAALAALFLLPGCRHPEGPRCHAHRARAGRPSPTHHHHVHDGREVPPPPPAVRH